ncbi:MAG: ead/Ea22-like family protein [Escherichia sp.]|nr:ead/Ea22-like family protein [Escherichia sp.]EFN7561049.1 ead/Ea22-like family protein [Escherichia coli]MDR3956514.1 ead/Ea22-like family protein [Escherichia sp.]HAX2077908.1 ead/Ea22-like family protein [Escherichia coli]
MSKIDYQALRAKAEKATCGEWSLEYGEGRFDGDDALIHREAAGYIPICRIEGAHPESGFDEDFQMEQQANAEFIAAANPATVLALLGELEAEAVMFCISGQNVDSEEHVSTSKAVVDAWVEEWNQVDGSPGEPLYKTMPLYYHAALPAPVVPEEATPENVEMLSGYVSTYKLTDSERDIAAEIWNACRAAMLHGKGE